MNRRMMILLVLVPAMMLVVTGIFFNASAQQVGEGRFLAVENARDLILEKPETGAQPVGDFSASGQSRDTIAVIEETELYYKVRYFSDTNIIGEGWLRKNGRINGFTVRPAYSIGGRLSETAKLPAREDRMRAVAGHPEWNSVMRFALVEGVVITGMTPEMVLAGFGEADEHMRYFTSSVNADQWTYYLAADKDFRLAFSDGKLHLFEDVTLHSAIETEKKLILDRKEYFYPHRMTSLKIMLGGAILMVAGYNGIQHERILSRADIDFGGSRVIENNNTANWLMIGVGFAAQAIGGYLFNYTPGFALMSYPPLSENNHGTTPMAGISIPLAFRK